MTARIAVRASLACFSAPSSTDDGRPASLVSSWMAVMKSDVPATFHDGLAAQQGLSAIVRANADRRWVRLDEM